MEKNIADVDEKFKIPAEIQKNGMSFYNIDQPPFRIYGIFREEDEHYHRIPEAVAKDVAKCKDGVYYLHFHTAGGRVRFMTDSEKISIIAKMAHVAKMPHFAFTGSCGFDAYVKGPNGYKYINTFVPPVRLENGYESCIDVPGKELKDITINFPLYSGVTELLIGIEEGATLTEAPLYTIEKPFVYYGSSITQGGCASRPGTSYQAIISRMFDCNYVNLGFSGSGLCEDEIIDYIKGLDMSVFVFDYDHNSPNVDHLRVTHRKMYDEVRANHPDLPIIMTTAPTYRPEEERLARVAVIRKDYDDAVAAGDKNVYFITGEELMALAGGDEGTVDTWHPTDLGFASMARALAPIIEKILKK